MMRRLLILTLALVLAAAICLAEEPLYVRKVDGLADDFALGMDVSSVISLEHSGVVFHGYDGQEQDLFAILADSGVNYIRVRVWNDPFDSEGHGYGGGNCDINTAIEIGKRATAHGMRLLVDFHYSDFWADPGKQQAPKAWRRMNEARLKEAIYAYTADCLTRLLEAGVDVGMVQIGNETNGSFCGLKSWKVIAHLMSEASRAVRDTVPGALVAVHFTNPESSDQMISWAARLAEYEVDYDVFSTSYYPYWHGTLTNLKYVLSTISTTYGKKVMVAETSYAATLEDTDFHGNTIGDGGVYEKPYLFSEQGQANEYADLVAAMHEIGGIGVFYWEGAWISVGAESWEHNAALWEEYGSGWASSYAGEYDPKDAGVYYGGSACDNQAMFDRNGYPRRSLQVFRLVREGQEVPLKAEAIDTVELSFDLNTTVTLPQTVNAILNDGSRQQVQVTWEETDLAAISAGGERDWTVKGEADGMEAVCIIHMARFNYVKNGSFEEDDASMWICDDQGKADELYVEEKKSDSLSGTRHYHFYSKAGGSVCFDLYQQLQLSGGEYCYSISLMGGDAGQTDCYAFVKVNGEIVASAPMQITSWNNWDTVMVPRFTCADGDEVAVGIHVNCAGAGAWGKIDCAVVNALSE